MSIYSRKDRFKETPIYNTNPNFNSTYGFKVPPSSIPNGVQLPDTKLCTFTANINQSPYSDFRDKQITESKKGLFYNREDLLSKKTKVDVNLKNDLEKLIFAIRPHMNEEDIRKFNSLYYDFQRSLEMKVFDLANPIEFENMLNFLIGIIPRNLSSQIYEPSKIVDCMDAIQQTKPEFFGTKESLLVTGRDVKREVLHSANNINVKYDSDGMLNVSTDITYAIDKFIQYCSQKLKSAPVSKQEFFAFWNKFRKDVKDMKDIKDNGDSLFTAYQNAMNGQK